MAHARPWFATVAVIALLAADALAAPVEGWPTRPIRLVVAQAPGGVVDQVARFLADRLTPALGVPVVVDNKAGASGMLGTEFVARAAPDGSTLLLATLSTHAVLPHVVSSAPFDPVRDFAPVVNVVSTVKALWVSSALPAKTFAEWAAYARLHPGLLNYASGGVGSVNHVDAQQLLERLGLECVHVPYNGPAAGIAAVASGEVQFMVLSITAGLPLAQRGRIRPLAVFSDRRSPLLPDVPTGSEVGMTGLDLRAWIGVMAPAGTAAAVVLRLNDEIVRVLRQPETLAWAERQALEVNGGTPEAFAREVELDVSRWGHRLRARRSGS